VSDTRIQTDNLGGVDVPADQLWLLAPGDEPSLGSHVLTPRRAYRHHGIYVGNGKVVHYAGLAYGLHRGPVEEVSLARFSRGRPVWVSSSAPVSFDSREVVRRARSRVGENCYRLLTNNCEHFCEWCFRGESRSYQVEAWLRRPARVLRAMIRFMARLVFQRIPDASITQRSLLTHRTPLKFAVLGQDRDHG
jgi:Lecithin retinol acyltransferase